jgi:hypothetical protein
MSAGQCKRRERLEDLRVEELEEVVGRQLGAGTYKEILVTALRTDLSNKRQAVESEKVRGENAALML